MKHQLPALKYNYDALEPYFDELTMKIHHQKHHQTYVDGLNKLVSENQELDGKKMTAETILSHIKEVKSSIRQQVINMAGGHANHSHFWTILSKPKGEKISGQLAVAVEKKFGSFENMQVKFNQLAKGKFGSGWVFLVIDQNKELALTTTSNQDSPLMFGQKLVLSFDVWEHAYYLKYQNRRIDYINAYWNLIDWKEANAYFLAATSI